MLEQKNHFKEKIKQTLTEHGFPGKRVTLPLEKMYQVAEEKKVNLNDILEELEDEGIAHEKLSEKILFYTANSVHNDDRVDKDKDEDDDYEYYENSDIVTDLNHQVSDKETADDFQKSSNTHSFSKIFERLKGMNLTDLSNPSKMMENAHKIMEIMTPEELKSIQDFYQNMSPNDRDQLLKKAKEMGLSQD